MSSNPVPAEQKLVDLLGSAASYNDKGVEWCRHSPEKVAEMQLGFQAEQIALAKEIGASRLGDVLRSAIETGAAARDWSGEYAALAEQILGVRRHGP
jgi:hypothetical protein